MNIIHPKELERRELEKVNARIMNDILIEEDIAHNEDIIKHEEARIKHLEAVKRRKL